MGHGDSDAQLEGRSRVRVLPEGGGVGTDGRARVDRASPAAPAPSSPSPAPGTCSSRPGSRGPRRPVGRTARAPALSRRRGRPQPARSRPSRALPSSPTGPHRGQRLHLVQQDGLVAEVHQGLRGAERQRPQARPVAAHQDQCLHGAGGRAAGVRGRAPGAPRRLADPCHSLQPPGRPTGALVRPGPPTPYPRPANPDATRTGRPRPQTRPAPGGGDVSAGGPISCRVRGTDAGVEAPGRSSGGRSQ